MKILSIFWGVCSGAALVIDGKIVGAVSEERFTREKNDTCFPEKSISWLLKVGGIDKFDLDRVAIVSNDVGADYILLKKHRWSVDDYLDENYNYWFKKIYNGEESFSIFDVMKHKIDYEQFPSEYWKHAHLNDELDEFDKKIPHIVSKFLGIEISKIVRVEHHSSHAHYSYFSSGYFGEKVLSFTLDGWGDGKNATIGIFDENGDYRVQKVITECNIARIYRYMTLLLGMKPSEHEYKVMGLAPYAREKYVEKALNVFRSSLVVDGLEFKWVNKPSDSYYWFKDRLEGVRFDNIAAALQIWTEELLIEWVSNAIKYFDINTISVSGGVALNVKAIGRLQKLSEVSKLFVGGSAGDESHIISTALMVEKQETKKPINDFVGCIPNLYLGPDCSKDEQKIVTEKALKFGYVVKPTTEYGDNEVCNDLVSGKVIARCIGNMEFGQRSLGNRSILADPVSLDIKEKINAAIKNRDFWMPFAPIVLDTYAKKYLVFDGEINSPYMTVAFDTTELGYSEMKAACHPADHSCRPQVLFKEANPKLYSLLECFSNKTKRGALLNTSFNLHGYPIVNDANDALYVFKNSAIDILLLDDFVLLKNEK